MNLSEATLLIGFPNYFARGFKIVTFNATEGERESQFSISPTNMDNTQVISRSELKIKMWESNLRRIEREFPRLEYNI